MAAQGISYQAKPTTHELGGRVIIITSTGDAALDVYDLALALEDGEITTSEAVAKLMHIGELLSEERGDTESIKEFVAAIEAKKGMKQCKIYHVEARE